MSKYKILIVEDEPAIAENISLYLNNFDFEVSGIAYDSEDAFEQLQANTPDAVILDINLDSDKDGIDIASHINQQYGIPFLFLTAYADARTVDRAKQVLPAGYIVKPFNDSTLLASLQIAISNHAATRNLDMPKLNLEKINKHLLSPLSEREFDVAQLVYEGITNTQIGEQLFVSLNTVKTHIKNIHLKLDANTRLRVMHRLKELMKK